MRYYRIELYTVVFNFARFNGKSTNLLIIVQMLLHALHLPLTDRANRAYFNPSDNQGYKTRAGIHGK